MRMNSSRGPCWDSQHCMQVFWLELLWWITFAPRIIICIQTRVEPNTAVVTQIELSPVTNPLNKKCSVPHWAAVHVAHTVFAAHIAIHYLHQHFVTCLWTFRREPISALSSCMCWIHKMGDSAGVWSTMYLLRLRIRSPACQCNFWFKSSTYLVLSTCRMMDWHTSPCQMTCLKVQPMNTTRCGHVVSSCWFLAHNMFFKLFSVYIFSVCDRMLACIWPDAQSLQYNFHTVGMYESRDVWKRLLQNIPLSRVRGATHVMERPLILGIILQRSFSACCSWS